MTIVSMKTVKRRNGRIYDRYVLKCDTCEIEFESIPARALKKNIHFHSPECAAKSLSSKTGVSRQKRDATCMKKYGVSHAMKTDATKELHRAIARKSYGVDWISKSPVFTKKSRETSLQRYGVDNPAKTEMCKEKTRRTNEERYGVSTPLKLAHIHSLATTPEALARSHETRKKRGSLRKSKLEDRIYAACINKGCCVERWSRVNGWSIDLHITQPFDVYVQVDGMFFHGLDRHLDVIASSVRPIDIVIHRTYFRDREQDAWFLAHKMKLVRIIDKGYKWYKTLDDDDIWNVIMTSVEAQTAPGA